jgi:hypothetical protein
MGLSLFVFSLSPTNIQKLSIHKQDVEKGTKKFVRTEKKISTLFLIPALISLVADF